MKPGLDWTLLEAFLAVAKHRNLGRAAQEMHCVTSNASTRIKQLELQLKTELFVRRRSGMHLTPDGERLVPLARALLLQREALFTQMRSEDAGELGIGAPESFLRTHLTTALAWVQKRYPETRVRCQIDSSDRIQESVLDQKVPLGVLISTSPPVHLETLVRWREQLALVLPKGQEVASKRTLERLKPLYLGEACFFGRSLMSFMDRKGVVARLDAPVNSLETILTLVEIGLGYSVLPKGFVMTHPRRKKFEVLPVQTRAEFSYFLVAKGGTVLSSAAKALLARLR